MTLNFRRPTSINFKRVYIYLCVLGLLSFFFIPSKSNQQATIENQPVLQAQIDEELSLHDSKLSEDEENVNSPVVENTLEESDETKSNRETANEVNKAKEPEREVPQPNSELLNSFESDSEIESEFKNEASNNYTYSYPNPQRHKIQSQIDCFEVSESGAVDVLGNSMGLAHYCMIENVCIDKAGKFVLFDDERQGQSFEFPRIASIHGNFTRFESTDAPTYFETHPDLLLEQGITVLLKHTYCCSHIRHFAEPLPTLLKSFFDLQNNETRKQILGVDDEKNISINRVVMVTRANVMSFYSEFMLEAAIRYGTALDTSLSIEIFKHNRSARCFEKAIVPGTSYLLFHNEEMADMFRDALYWEINRVSDFVPEKFSMRRYSKQNSMGLTEFIKPSRLVLIASRNSRRKIADKPEYYKFLSDIAAQYGAVTKVVEFGKLTPYEQARNCINAGMLWSIHGNDLSNIILMQKGSAVIELNPIFFFEPGYYEMSKRLGLDYYTWTCTSPHCAFSGNRTAWNQVFGKISTFRYDDSTGIINMNGKANGEWYEPFVYPSMEYVGETCEQCDKMSHASPLSEIYYSSMRESDIKVMPYRRDLENIFHSAAIKLGWKRK